MRVFFFSLLRAKSMGKGGLNAMIICNLLLLKSKVHALRNCFLITNCSHKRSLKAWVRLFHINPKVCYIIYKTLKILRAFLKIDDFLYPEYNADLPRNLE